MSRILIVDDDAAVRGILFDLLSENCECQTAGSVEEALQLLDRECYEVVLSDIHMPDASGVELLNRVQEAALDTNVIFISGGGSRQEKAALMQAGAFAFVDKPFDLADIEEIVKRALDHKTRSADS